MSQTAYGLFFDLDSEFFTAPWAFGFMLAADAGQTKRGATLRAGAKDVFSGVSRHTHLGLSAEFALEAEPCVVFPTARRDVAGEEAEHRPNQQKKRDHIAENGYDC